MTRQEILIMQAEAFRTANKQVYEGDRIQIEELMADFVIDRFDAFFDDAKMVNNDQESE